MFIHLHNHSDYSLLDGACRIPDLVQTAIDHGAGAVGLTDHGNLFGALDFYTKCRDAGVNPIIGCELYLAFNSRHDKRPGAGGELRYHQVLLAKNLTGYRNLCKLVSEAYLTGFYYKPRIDKELLSEYHEGLICLSSCMQGEIPQLLLENNPDAASEAATFYKNLFGEDFYIELHRHNLPEQDQLVRMLAQMARDFDLKVVATNDAHYLRREHAAAHDVLLCVGTQSKRDDTDRLRFGSDEFYLKTPQEMEALFNDLPEALAATEEIAEKCKVELPLGQKLFPVFKLLGEPDVTPDRYLERLAREGFRQRYGDSPPENAEQRLQTELEVIASTGFSNYFLITWDFVRWAKEQGIPVGPGRGSAAGCLVSYCLGITNLDPIRYGLIFERFLNPERVSPPDIDIDFADDRREEVIAYVREKYGEDSVCRITSFGRMAARSAIRDTARAMNLSYPDADRIARLIPEGVKDMSISRALDEVPELKTLVNSDPRFQETVELATHIEGALRHASTHAAGVVIAPGKMTDFIPVYKQGGDDKEVFTQFDMYWMDAVGLLKMDFLGLQTLQELDLTIKALRKRGLAIDLNLIELDDPRVMKLFGEGATTGVFQFESGGMRENLMKLKPERLEDLIAMNALYRPGPMQMIDEFIACRHGRKKATYLHPRLEPILRDTNGVIVYQEQVIRIATDLAGFSLGKADNLRWAMGKKKMDLMRSLKVEFIGGCVSGGIERAKAEAIYDACEQFANYGFVKAHSAGYAMIAYQCAYLKVYHTSDFLAACLTVRHKNPVQMMNLLAECRSQSIEVLPPDINESERGFAWTPKGIRFGLTAVRNVGDAAVAAVEEARLNFGKFESLHHFLTSVDLRVVNKKVTLSLIDAGAFDALGPNRASMLNAVAAGIAYAQAIHEERIRGQTMLFGGVGVDPAVHIPPPNIKTIDEWPTEELQSREKLMLGYYISSHPLERYRREADLLASHRLADKDEFTGEMPIRVCAVITAFKQRMTKNGERMATIVIEDLTGSIECLVFPRVFKNYQQLLVVDGMVGVAGRIGRSDTDEEPKLKVEDIIPLEQAMETWGRAVRIKLHSDKVTAPLCDRFEHLFAAHPGNNPVYIDLSYPDGAVRSFRLGQVGIKPTRGLIDRLGELIDAGHVSVS